MKTPVQKVVPIKEKKEETLFSLYIPSDKLKALKIKSAQSIDVYLQEMIDKGIITKEC